MTGLNNNLMLNPFGFIQPQALNPLIIPFKIAA